METGHRNGVKKGRDASRSFPSLAASKYSWIGVIGLLVILYFFYLPLLVFWGAPKTDMGGGHFITFSPPHVDPIYRWRGVLLGAVTAATGSIILFVKRNRKKSLALSVLRLIGSLIALAVVVGWVTAQSYVAQLPDHLAEEFQVFRGQIIHEGYGVGWPSQEEANRNDVKFALARGSVEIVMANTKNERNHAGIEQISDQMFYEWQQACTRAAIADGAELTPRGIICPRHWTQWPVVNPADVRIYLYDQRTGWCIKKTQNGEVTLWGYPP